MTGKPSSLGRSGVPEPIRPAGDAGEDPALVRALAEIEILNRLTETQAEQITTATRAATLAEARVDALVGAAADRHVLRASIQAMERRLQDLRQRQAGRDQLLSDQMLEDGALIAALEAERDRLLARVEVLERALAAARGQLDALRDERDHLLGSTSWKVTAPLRALRRMLRRG